MIKNDKSMSNNVSGEIKGAIVFELFNIFNNCICCLLNLQEVLICVHSEIFELIWKVGLYKFKLYKKDMS